MQTRNGVQQLQDGRQLVLKDIIGKGGYGEVWRASLGDTRRPVAVKCVEVLTEKDERSARTELYALRKFKRSWYSAVPHLIAYELNKVELKIVMELFDGTLTEYLKDITGPGPIQIGEVAIHPAEVIRQMSRALNVLHGFIVHKDLKPDNILVRINDGQVRIKVTDFGLSKIVAPDDGFQASGSGTPIYNAPETILHYNTCELTSKVDVFAAGIVYYQTIFGVRDHPFGSVDNVSLILVNIQNGDRSFDDRCVKGSEVYHLLDKMLSMTPGERPPMDIVEQHPCHMTNDAKMSFLSKMLHLKEANKHILTAIENWMHRDWTELSAYSTMHLTQKNWLTTFFTEEEIQLFGIRETTYDNTMTGIKEVLQQVVKTAKNREKDVFDWLQRGWLGRPSLFLFIWLESTTSRNVKQSGYSFHMGRSQLQKLAEINNETNMLQLLKTMTPEEVNWQSPADGKTALHLAVSSASEEVVMRLCEHEARWDIQDGAGWTPLHYAAKRSKGFLDIFFDGGNEITAVHNTGWSPLHVASASVLYESVELLLDKGAHVNVRDGKGDTPLHIAVQTAPRRKGELQDHPEESVLPNSRFECELAVNPACPINENDVPFKIAELLIQCGAEVNGKNSHGGIPLHLVSSGDYHEIAKLLHQHGASINEKDNSAQTPLHWAVFRNAHETVRLLTEWGPAINLRVISGQSPVRLAVKGGSVELVEELLDSGADINETTESGLTLLHTATMERFPEMAAVLLKRGAQVNAKNVYGQTPLHFAMEKNDPTLAELLLEYGADLNITGLHEQTPLHWAMENQYLDIVGFLLGRGLDVNQKDANSGTAFHCAVEQGHYDTVLLFLGRGAKVNQRDFYGETPLHQAAGSGYFEIAELLVQRNADVNVKCDNESTPLHVAVLNKHYEIAKLLLENSAQVNETDGFQQTPLHLTTGSNSFQFTKLLLDYGALIDAKDWKGQTPLYNALTRNDVESARLLLESGAAIQDSYIQGETPLYVAAKKSTPQMVQLLLAYGATVNEADKHGETFLHFAVQKTDFQTAEILIKNGAAVNQTTKYGKTALHFASTRNSEMVKLLLDHGALVNEADENGETSLHLAVRNTNFETADILIKNGAAVNQTNKCGETALHVASTRNSEMVKILLDHGAFVDEKDNNGRNALSKALANNCSDISQLLRDHGATEGEVNHSEDDWLSFFLNDGADQ